MAMTKVYHQSLAADVHLGDFDEALLRRHSLTIDNMMRPSTNKPVPNTIVLTGLAPGPFRVVLWAIKQDKGDALKIIVHDLPLLKVVLVSNAVEYLQIAPAQAQIDGHICWYIANHPLTVDEVIAVHQEFEARQATSKVWRVLVHQVAWDICHMKYSEADKDTLDRVTRQSHRSL